MSTSYGYKVYTKWLEIINPLAMHESQAHMCRIERSSSLVTRARLYLVWPTFTRIIA